MSGDLQGEFFLNDCTKFYVDAGFVGDFEMFTLHTRFSHTFVVMGQLISHNAHYAEYDSAFRDMLSGVWLSLLLLFPYHLGLWLAPKGSIANELFILQSEISGQPIPSILVKVDTVVSSSDVLGFIEECSDQQDEGPFIKEDSDSTESNGTNILPMLPLG